MFSGGSKGNIGKKRVKYYLLLRLRDIEYLSRILKWHSRRKKANFIKSSLFCKTFSKSTPKFIFFLSDEVILTHSLLKNTIFTFFKRDSGTFKLSNCYKQLFPTSCRKYINDRNELQYQNYVYFLSSLKG